MFVQPSTITLHTHTTHTHTHTHTQTVLIVLSGRTDYAAFPLFLSFFNPDFTFDLCITPYLTAFHRLILQYVTPIYILVLLGGVLLLTKYTRVFSKLLGKHSFLQGLWLLFLISYFNISNTSLELLHCRFVTPLEGGETRYVLSHDASVSCFSGPHLPVGIIAITIAAVFVFPMPVYVYIAMHSSKMKPITDVYCSPYVDNRRWWVVLSLARRLLLVLVGVFVQNYLWRHFGLLFCIGLIQIVYVLTWPYQTRVDNYFGFLTGWMLLFIALITQPDAYLYIDLQRGVSLFFVVAMIAISLLLLLLETILRFRDQTVGKFFKDDVQPVLVSFKESVVDSLKRESVKSNIQELEESTQSSVIPRAGTVDATSYREPLLDSIYASGSKDWSINTSQRDSLDKKERDSTTTRPWTRRKERITRKRDEDSLEAVPGTVDSRTRTTIVSPAGHSGYMDSGFAATSYVNGESSDL